jgi:hypothetical protein
VFLLGIPANARHLAASIQSLCGGQAQPHELTEDSDQLAGTLLSERSLSTRHPVETRLGNALRSLLFLLAEPGPPVCERHLSDLLL